MNNLVDIWIVVSTIVFTLAAFAYPAGYPYSWGFRGFSIILAIFGWIIIVSTMVMHR